MRKTGLTIAGILLILVGTIWFFQGIGVIPGSFMTGQNFWAVAGALSVFAGIAALRSSRRKLTVEGTDASPEIELDSDEAHAKM